MNRQEIISNIEATISSIDRIFSSRKKLEDIDRYINSDRKYWKITLKIFWILGSVILISFHYVLSLKESIFSDDDYLYILITILMLSFTISFFCALIFYSISSIFRPLRKKRRLANFKEKIEKEINIIERELIFCDKKCVFPKKYHNTYSLSKIKEYFEHYRVDNVKEAINLYEDEAFKIQNIKHLQYLAEQQTVMIANQRAMVFQQGITNSLLIWKKYF